MITDINYLYFFLLGVLFRLTILSLQYIDQYIQKNKYTIIKHIILILIYNHKKNLKND
jgi:hypothetical protein